jgi:hypothetical protein
MTALDDRTDDLPDFDNVPCHGSAITIAGVGATMGSTLAMESALIRKHDRVYVMLLAECQKISFPDDKDGNQIRVAHLHPEEAFWADGEYAQKFIAEQRSDRQRRLEEMDGQLALDDEQAALDREQLDATGTPADIADAAAERAKNGG